MTGGEPLRYPGSGGLDEAARHRKSMFTKSRSRLALAIIIILLLLGGLGIKTPFTERIPNVARPEITFQIRHPWNRDAVQVRLDIDRLRAYDLSKEDVMKALMPSGMVDPEEPLPPSGVVFDKHLLSPDKYKSVILKANVEGNIVRLKDVAKVDAVKK
jgi:multidrug efflux pump subunit AcrB